MLNFRFDWNWIKDKQINIVGNHYTGMIIISDKDGIAVKIYGYELVR